jgi:hypothetical protein
MFTAENCPYIVIGVPAYAPKSDASLGFAMATRRLKSRSDAPFSVQDLTSALSRIESGDVGQQLTFAVPADFSLFITPLPTSSRWPVTPTGEELLNLDSQSLTDSDRELVANLLLREGLELLLSWNWLKADLALKSCLKISKHEPTRDEALNLIAACLVMQGDTPKAIQALSKAVEGQWNLRLQANLALLAIEEDPKRAIEQMSFLVDGAQGAEEKLKAIRMAIGLWRQVQEEELGVSDDEEFDPMPEQLLTSIVQTLMSKDISEEDFFDLGLFVARVSSQSISRTVLNQSKFSGRSSCEIVLARSQDFSYYIDHVVRLAYSDIQRPDFIDTHIDGIVEEVCQGLFEGNENLAPIAFSFLDQGLGVETMHQIWMRGALVLILHKVLGEDDSPNEKFITWLKEAKTKAQSLSLPDELRDLTAEILSDASDMLMRLQLREFFSVAVDVENMSNEISQSMNGFWNRLATDKNEVRRRTQLGVSWCNEQIQMFIDFESLGLHDVELRREVSELKSATIQIKNNLQRFV